MFRKVSDVTNGPMMRNYRETQVSKDSTVFHILPSKNNFTTLLPISVSQQQQTYHDRLSDSSPISEESAIPNEVPLLPPGMFPREILVQPSGMRYGQVYGYPGSSSKCIHQGQPPIPFLLPIAPVSGSQYRNFYGYSPPMMFESPHDHNRIFHMDKSTSTVGETSETEIRRVRKQKRKPSKKSEVSSMTKGNKVTFEDGEVKPRRSEAEWIARQKMRERKSVEERASSSKPYKGERESRQRVNSRPESRNYEELKDMHPICDMEKMHELGLTTKDILETRGWMFVKPYMESALPSSCKEAKYYELGKNNQGAYL